MLTEFIGDAEVICSGDFKTKSNVSEFCSALTHTKVFNVGLNCSKYSHFGIFPIAMHSTSTISEIPVLPALHSAV